MEVADLVNIPIKNVELGAFRMLQSRSSWVLSCSCTSAFVIIGLSLVITAV